MIKNKKNTLNKVLLDWIPIVGAIAMIISYIPQLWLTYTTQNVAGQSTTFWALLTFAILGYVIQQIGVILSGVKSYTGLASQILNFIGAFAMLVATIIFR